MFLYAKIRKNLHLQPLEGVSKPIVGVKVPFDRRREGFNNTKIMGLSDVLLYLHWNSNRNVKLNVKPKN